MDVNEEVKFLGKFKKKIGGGGGVRGVGLRLGGRVVFGGGGVGLGVRVDVNEELKFL